MSDDNYSKLSQLISNQQNSINEIKKQNKEKKSTFILRKNMVMFSFNFQKKNGKLTLF